MRLPLRAAALAAAAVACVTCAEAPTAPSTSAGARSSAHVGLAPRFTAAAAETWSRLAAFALDVTNVRVRLVNENGALAKDTTIAFPADRESLTVELPVAITGTQQTFTASLELRGADNLPLFSGTQQVTARSTALPTTAPAAPLSVEYVGPGASARTVRLTPAEAGIPATASTTLLAEALDASGIVMAGTPFLFASSDASLATLVPSGASGVEVRGTGRRGVVTITASTPTKVSSTARVTFVPAPSVVTPVAGATQTAVAGRAAPAPLVVEVRASDNLPLAGVSVRFAAASAGAAVGTASALTDEAGRASTTLIAGRQGGTYLFSATVGALAPASATLTATPAPLAAVAVIGGQRTASAGSAPSVPLQVRVTNDLGDPASGATVRWAIASGAGTLAKQASSTDDDGIATVGYLAGTKPGAEGVAASVDGVSPAATVAIAVSAGAPASLDKLSGDAQTAAVGSALAASPRVRVSDAYGNPVPGAAVTFAVSAGEGSLVGAPGSPSARSTNILTGTDGEASPSSWTLGAVAGAQSVTASVGTLSATFAAKATSLEASRLTYLQAPPASLAVGAVVEPPVRVQLGDALGNAVRKPGVVVTASATIDVSGATWSGAATTTDADGVATISLPAYKGTAGLATLTFSSPGLAPLSAAVSLVPGAAARLGLAVAPSLAPISGAPFAQQPTVTVTDAGGNALALAGVAVTATLSPGASGTLRGAATATTNTTGRAIFTDLAIAGPAGRYLLAFSSPGLVPTTAMELTLGAPELAVAQLVLADSLPATIAVGASPAATFRLRLADAAGAAVRLAGVTVTGTAAVTTPTGTSTLASVSAATDADGVAVLALPPYTGAIGTLTLTATAASVKLVTAPVSIVRGAAALMTIVAGDGLQGSVGRDLPTLPAVKVTDAGGNAVPGATVSWRVTAGGGGLIVAGSAQSTYSSTTGSAGETSAPTWRLGSSAGTNTLVASLDGTTVTQSFTATGVGAVATRLTLNAAPSPVAASGVPLATVPVVLLRDDDNNPVMQSGVRVDLAVTAGTATPSVASATTDAAGLAHFTGLSFTGTAGALTLSFSVAGFASPLTTGITLKTLPAAPTITSLTVANRQLGIVFTAGSAGSDAITNYEYSIDGGNSWTTRNPAATTSPLVVTGLTNGTTYPVRLRAVSGAGTGPASAATNGVPGVPTIVADLAGGNWSSNCTWVGGVAPSSGDNVSIPNGATVTLDASVAVMDVTLAGTASVPGGGYGLTIRGTLTDPNAGLRVSAISFADDPAPVSAATPTITMSGGGMVTFNGPARLAGNLVVDGAVGVNGASGSLTLGGRSLAVSGNFRTQVDATLVMTNAADALTVNGDATFDGASTSGLLSAGTMTVKGAFAQSSSSSATSFAPSGSFTTVFAGSASQAVSFASPGGSYFQALAVNGGATLSLGSDVAVKGTLTHAADTAAVTVSAVSSRRLTVSGLSQAGTNPMNFDNVRLLFTDGSADAQFNNVRFQNIGANDAFVVDRSSGSYSFDRINFDYTLAGFYYLRVTGASPSVSLTRATPVTGALNAQFAKSAGSTVSWTN